MQRANFAGASANRQIIIRFDAISVLSTLSTACHPGKHSSMRMFRSALNQPDGTRECYDRVAGISGFLITKPSGIKLKIALAAVFLNF